MPKYQAMPDMTGEKYEEFKRDIQENGVKVPVIHDENGDTIDGHQRERVCKELGIECPVEVRAGLTEDEKRVLVKSLNYHRRHLSPQQQHETNKVAAENYKRRKAAGENVTQAQVAKEFGVSRERLSKNVTVSQNPETPTAKQNTEIQQKNEPSVKKIITDTYPLKGGKKGYQVKTTDGLYFFKQSKDLALCETIKKAINGEKYDQDDSGVNKAKALANDIVNQLSKQDKETKTTFIKEEVVDFSFLTEEPQETEEDKELSNALNEMASKAELMAEFENAICVPIVADSLLRFFKEMLSKYPDTIENANNPDRKAFVNVFNLFKKIIRKGD